MFVLLLLVLNVLMLFFTFSSFSDKKRIFVLLAESMSVFLCLYSLLSALMWVFEVFSVEFCLLAVTVLVAAIFAIVYFKSGKKVTEFFSFGEIILDRNIIINRIIIIVATLISLGAYSTIGIGYNDGNAYAQTISILNGQKSLEFEVDEYEKIAPNSPYEYYFFDSVSNINREDFTASYRIDHDYTLEGKQEIMIGKYGSNPVYPSLLALAASIFGTTRMAYIQVLFAFCVFVFVNEILRVLKCDWKLRSLLVLLLSVSPIVVYCNHTALIEPLLGFCMVMFMYYLLCKKDRLQILSALGVITFAFLHSSVYTMIPLFLVLYWMHFIHTGKMRHLISSGIMVVGYIISFIFLNITAYENTSINYRLGIPFLGKYYFSFAIIIFVITLVAGLILAFSFRKIDSNKIKEFEKGIGSKIFKVLVSVSTIAPILVIIALIILRCNSFQDFLSITFIVFIVCSGVLLVPYILFRLIFAKYPIGIREASAIVMFIYSVVLYSCVMKPMLEGYYYYSRYISSFIPFVIILAGMMLRLLKREEKYFIPVIGIIIMLVPYTFSLLDSRAETRFDSAVLEDVMDYVADNSDDNTVVFVEKNIMKYLYYPLISIEGVNVYPIEPGYFEMFSSATGDFTSKAIYISDDMGNDYASKGTLKYLNHSVQRISSKNDVSEILGLPNGFSDRDGRKIQIIEFDTLYQMLDSYSFEEMDMEDLDLTINRIEIGEDGIAHIIVSLTDQSVIFRNEKLFLSYHLEYENAEDEYEQQRILFGPLTIDDYLIDVDLASQPEDVTVVIDVVEEGVAWYSYEHKVPVIVFNETDEGWEYKTYNFFTKLK